VDDMGGWHNYSPENPDVISEEEFRKKLQEPLGDCWDRSLKVFLNYGPYQSSTIFCFLAWAIRRELQGWTGTLDRVLKKLEKHWEEYLMPNPPDLPEQMSLETVGTIMVIRDVILRIPC